MGIKLVNLTFLFPVWWYSSVFHYHSSSFGALLIGIPNPPSLAGRKSRFWSWSEQMWPPVIVDIKLKQIISSIGLNNSLKEVWYNKNLSMNFFVNFPQFFIIRKYVKIRFKKVLEVKRSKILQELNKRDCICLHTWFQFYGVSHVKTDLHNKYVIFLCVWLIFWAKSAIKRNNIWSLWKKIT